MFDSSTSDGPPGEKTFRGYRPPRKVWVDLSQIYPVGPPRGDIPDGLDLQETVRGELSMWKVSTSGYWFGWVQFMINEGRGGSKTGQWVPGYALRPRDESA